MNRPFTILLLPLIAGILLSHYFIIDKILVLFILFISILGFIYNIIKERNSLGFMIIMFFSIGLFITIFNQSSLLIDKYDKRVDAVGIVDDILRKDNNPNRYIIKIKEIDNQSIKEKIVLNIRGDSNLELGDKILFNGELREASTNGNPRLYNYRLNLMTDKIYSTMSIKEHSIRYIDKDSKTINYTIRNRSIKDIEGIYDKYLDESKASIIKSIILGKSFYLEEESLDLYRNLGLAHILAVSGLHIGIISGFFIFIFSRLGIKRKTNTILTLTILWIYAYIIGFPTSILRANIMISILLYSRLIHKPYNSINTLSFAMFLLLIINPYYLFNIGFQLSFIASFSIIVFMPRIKDLFYPINNYISNSLASIIGVQIGIIPIQLYYFNNFNILSILSNLILIPILSLALILAFIMIIFNYIFSYVNIIIGFILNLLLSIQSVLLKLLDKDVFNFTIFSPEIISVVIYFILVLIILRIININGFHKDISNFFIVSLVIVLIFNTYLLIDYDNIELHFIDVGQGDSLLIRTKGKDYLVDTGGSLFGSFDIGKNITLAYLEKLGIRKLDAVFISHFHEDHCEGILALIDSLDIDIIFGSHIPIENLYYQEIIKHRIPYRELKTGDNLKLNNNLSLLNIWPDKDVDMRDNENNISLVSILSDSNTNILLTGDMEKEVENIIIEKYSMDIDIIKVPHHGSSTSSTEEFLNNIRPEIGIVSLGKKNMYGHPSKEVIDRYKDIGANIYRTDESGMIKLVLDEKGYEIETYLENGDRKKIDLVNYIYENIFTLLFYLVYYMVVYILLKFRYTWGEDKFEL